MRLSHILKTAGALALTASLAGPAFAGVVKLPTASTNVGVDAGCQYFIVCKSSTDPWNSEACNNGYATVIKQGARK